ncbi:PQQ-binding-like beta-propeller repeat protein [bacterium]|nr:PQQ-binding-like beta-propeller repeat protein [bacterium]
MSISHWGWIFRHCGPRSQTPLYPLFLLLLASIVLSGCGGGSAEIREIPAPPVQVSVSSPAIIGSTIYVGSTDGRVHSLSFAIPNAAPSVNWELNVNSSIDSSPALSSDGTIYFGADNGFLYAVDSNAVIQWTYPAGSSIKSSPAVGCRGRIYFGSESGSVFALNPDGSLLWSFPTGGPVSSSPSLYGTSALFIGSEDQKLYALTQEGVLRWSFTADNAIHSSPAIDGEGRVLFGSDQGTLYSVDFSGALLWSDTTGGPLHSSPILDEDQNIYVGSNDGSIYGYDLSGNRLFQQATGDKVSGSGTVTTSSQILFGSRSARVYRFTTDGTLLAQTPVDSAIASSPNIGSNYGLLTGVFDKKILWLPSSDVLSDRSSWPRFRGNGLQNGYLPCVQPSQVVSDSQRFGASTWGLDPLGNVQSKDNANFSGLLLGSPADRYLLEATLFTNGDTTNDDDTIGLVIAAVEDPSGNLHTLSAVRSTIGTFGGIQGAIWALVSVQLSSTDAIQGTTLWVNGLSLLTEINQTEDNWNDFPAGVRVQVEKVGSSVRALTSSLDKTALQPLNSDFELSLDLNSSPYLQRFLAPTRGGFAAHSQPFATFGDIRTDGAKTCKNF